MLMSACAGMKNPSAETSRNTVRPYQETIAFNGKILVQYQQNEQEQTLSGGYEWQQTPTRINILLSNPIGQTMAKIQQTEHGAILEQAKQEPISGPDIEQLLARNFGWSIPANGLKIWMQGYDLQPDGERASVPSQNNFSTSSQGWSLRFVDWQSDEGHLRPRRIDLSRTTQEFGELKIRIIINQREE
jgi:outer membrane lipoprotein LolB